MLMVQIIRSFDCFYRLKVSNCSRHIKQGNSLWYFQNEQKITFCLMISIPSDSFPEVMARHNTQTFEHFLNLHFIQVQIINMPFSYIRVQMICLVILSFKNSIIFRKEKLIIIARVSFTSKQEKRASLSQEQSMHQHALAHFP